VNLHGDVSAEVSVDLGLLGGMDSGVERSSNIIEALVSDFIDHLFIINIYYITSS
jgi:hypothetical protein